MEHHRGQWGSNLGFLMATVGAAVGLGNIWAFPYKMGANGGFPFLVIYLILAVLIGFPIMLSELAIGRKVGRSVLVSYQRVGGGLGTFIGWLAMLSPYLILSFYTVAADTKQLADQFINVLSVTIMGTSYQVACLTGIVRAGGNTKFVLYNDLIFMWGLVLPLSALGAFVWELSPLVVFIFLKCDQILKCFVAVWQVNSYHWVRRLTREEPASDPQPAKA